MPYRQVLVTILLALGTMGVATVWFILSPSTARAPRAIWWLFLVLLPIALAIAIMMRLAWAAMACVAYGTIGLALDLATLVSILGGREESDLTLALSVVSGGANFVLILFGSRAFWTVLQAPPPR